MCAEVDARVPAGRGDRSERLDLRVSAETKRLLEDAAASEDRTLTDFVLASASIAARRVLADRREFTLSPERWAAFTVALEREPRYLPGLATLLAGHSIDPE